MQIKATLMKSTELGLSLSMIVVLALAACGGGGASETHIVTTQLSGTNGDMSKYLGSWVSGCGISFRMQNLTLVGTDGVINEFSLTAISGVNAQGTFTANTFYNSTSCSGTAAQTTGNVSLQYASNVYITDQTPFYAGSADRINLGATGSVSATPYNIGFRSNFSQFQLTSANSNFYSGNLIYTKR
ncbi:MAG: hypothetical protein OEV23_05720 [Gallionella sp.]|nr:hypothetical protein [Gallionella sp.]